MEHHAVLATIDPERIDFAIGSRADRGTIDALMRSARVAPRLVAAVERRYGTIRGASGTAARDVDRLTLMAGAALHGHRLRRIVDRARVARLVEAIGEGPVRCALGVPTPPLAGAAPPVDDVDALVADIGRDGFACVLAWRDHNLLSGDAAAARLLTLRLPVSTFARRPAAAVDRALALALVDRALVDGGLADGALVERSRLDRALGERAVAEPLG